MLSRPQNCSEGVQTRSNSHRARPARAVSRSVDSVTLLAVSKGQSSRSNRRRRARRQSRTSARTSCRRACPRSRRSRGRELTWHFIGRLQANKTRPVAENFAWVHAVDRLKIAERLSAQRPLHAPPLNVCLQLHVGGEASKGGVEAADIAPLAAAVRALPRIRLRGLMCMPPAEDRRRAPARSGFARRARSSTISTNAAWASTRLSMGTSARLRIGHRRRRDDGAHRHGHLRPARLHRYECRA